MFRTEVINVLGPWKSVGQVAWETLHRVSWTNTERLHGAIGHRPPQDLEEAFHAALPPLETAAQVLNKKPSRKPGAMSGGFTSVNPGMIPAASACDSGRVPLGRSP